MVGIATGVFKKLSIKRQTALKTIAPPGAAGTARYMRRTSSTLDLSKPAFASAEINDSQQDRDERHGTKAGTGTISGELSAGGYQLPMEGVMRKVAVAGPTSGPLATIAAAVVVSDAGNQGTFTRTGGSFITDGFKVGHVIRASGFVAPAVANNAHNALIIALTPLVMTVLYLDRKPMVAKAAGDNVTISTPGKIIWVPQSGHTKDYFTIEHWHADVQQSEVFKDCVFTGFTVNVQPNGMVTVEFPVMALDQMPPGVAEYFTSPAGAPTGGIFAGVNGALIIDGAPAGIVTGLTLTAAGGHTAVDGVIGENVGPDIFPGKFVFTGQMTVLFQDAVVKNKFLNEEEGKIVLALTTSNAPNADVVAFSLPRVKYNGSSKNDGFGALSQTVPIKALEAVLGGDTTVDYATTVSVQDTAFA